MEIAEHQTGKITVVEIKGRVDGNTAKAFADRLMSLIKAGHARLVVRWPASARRAAARPPQTAKRPPHVQGPS
jgi:hypothetical protein